MSRGQSPGWPGIPKDRIVAVVASLANGREQVGSGYLVGGRLVLTAEHCTRDKRTEQPSTSLRVIRASDGHEAVPTEVVASADVDVAVLHLADAPWPADLPAPPFKRVDRTHSGELEDCEAIGYPLWQLDRTDEQRSTAELHGKIRQTDDDESGFLLLRDPLLESVAAPPATASADRDDPASPWGGLSGALVFYAGSAVGVVVQHHPRQGASALRLVPFDRIAADTSDEKTRALAAALGLPPADRMPLVRATAPSLEGLADWLVDGDFPGVEDVDPYRLGATASDYGGSSTYGRRDPYVPRSIDDELRNALGPGSLVLLVGPSKAGKTRTAFEALRSCWGQARVVVPVVGHLGELVAHPRLRATDDPVVVWLDDVYRYLASADPLTPGILARLTARPGPTVVLATLRTEQRNQLRDTTGELSRDTRNLLDDATTIELASSADDPVEQARAAEAYPGEELSEVGLAERLANAPDLLTAYHDAKAADPLRYVLLRIAIDWARVGGPRPIPEPDLVQLARDALWEERPDLEPAEEQVSEALAWARAPVAKSGRVAPLSTHPLPRPEHVRGYWPFDYLVAADDGQTGSARTIPEAFWAQVLDRAPAEDAFAIGMSAHNRGNTPAALSAFRKGADNGDSGAMVSLGKLSMRLDPPDVDGARHWFEAAADRGNTEGLFGLGVLLEYFDSPDVDGRRRWYQAAAERGHTGAMFHLAALLDRSDPPDVDGARRWYEAAASGGHTHAMFHLGVLLAGLDPPDIEGARRWYEAAADRGHTDAMFNLGVLLADLDPPDVEGARRWYVAAAGGGHTAAMFNLAVLLLGLDPPDVEGARRWYKAAADGGDTDASYSLGVLLGGLDPPDLEGARRWYEAAADLGHTAAMFNLGVLLAGSDPPDLEGARRWYEAAADGGDTDAMFNLGVLLGGLDPPDVEGALHWYKAAAESGRTDAMFNLGVLLWGLASPDDQGGRHEID